MVLKLGSHYYLGYFLKQVQFNVFVSQAKDSNSIGLV